MIELLVVITIISVLASMLLPALSQARRRARHGRWIAYSNHLRADDRAGAYFTFDTLRGATDMVVPNLAAGAGLEGNYDARKCDAWRGELHFDVGPKNRVGRWGKEASYFDGASWLRTGYEHVHLYQEAVNPKGDFTLLVWVKLTGGQGNYRAAISNRWHGASLMGSILYAGSGNTWEFWTGRHSSWDRITGGEVELDAWTQVVGTFTATGGPDANGVYLGEKRLYINGELVAGPTVQGYKPSVNQLDFGVNPTADFCLTGFIDEGGIWSRALNADEVKANYQMGAD